MTRPTLVVLDGTAMIFRAHFSSITAKAPDGTEAGALLGMSLAFGRFVRELDPTHLVVVFDAGRKTFRNEIEPTYKANRSAPPDDLVVQFHRQERLVQALGAPSLKAVGWEADDLMATLAVQAVAAEMDVVLVSSDKDICQLVTDRVVVYDPNKAVRYGRARIEKRFGVRADQLVDYSAITGDSVDNIPGVPGVGPKGAVAVLTAFDHLEGIYANLDGVAGLPVRGAKGLAKKLETHRESAFHCRELTRLRADVPLDLSLPDDAVYSGPTGEAEAVLDSLGFRGPLMRLRQRYG